MHIYYVYIATNAGKSVLYVGVTNSIARRMSEHADGKQPGFTQRYRIKHLLYVEASDSIQSAIFREKQIKKWSRSKKLKLIRASNPTLQFLDWTIP